MDGDKVTEVKLDLVFPVLHGLHGEDGTIQGLLELAKIPYVGCGVLASAVGMDKLYTKIIVNNLGIRQADYEPVMSEQLADMDAVTARIEAHLHTLYLLNRLTQVPPRESARQKTEKNWKPA